jgi:GTPase SAR1 family protein
MEAFQRDNPSALFYETSARTGFHIEESFKEMAQRLFEKGPSNNTSTGGFRITANGSIKRPGTSGGLGSGGIPSDSRHISNQQLEDLSGAGLCGAGYYIDSTG